MSEIPSAQPTESAAFTAPENPITRNEAEVAAAELGDHGQSSHPSAHRGPGQDYDPQGGTNWAQSRGVRGGGPTNERETEETRYVDERNVQPPANASVDGEQLATYSEGKVADAVDRKSGTQRYRGGDGEVGEPDFASELDRKKAEQASAREEVKRERKAGQDVDGGSEHRRSQMGNESLVES